MQKCKTAEHNKESKYQASTHMAFMAITLYFYSIEGMNNIYKISNFKVLLNYF